MKRTLSNNQGEEKEEQLESPITAEELDNIVDNNIQEDLPIKEEITETPQLPPPPEPEEEEEEEEHHSALDEINEERRVTKLLTTVSFLTEYSKATYRQIEDVAEKLGLTVTTARRYIKDYINLVKDSIASKTYPDAVLLYYNREIDDEDKKLKFHHLDKLKDIVKKYSAYDVDAILGKNLNNSGSVTTKVETQQPSLSLINPSPSSSSPTPSADIQRLEDGITSLQLIRFGLLNTFGQHATMKISNMLGADPTPYLMDEQNLKSLLLMAGSTDSRAQYFINWLKTNAHYVAHPVGFLSHVPGSSYFGNGSPNYYSQTGGGGNGSGGGGGGWQNYGNADQLDEMDKFYYDIRVYQKGLPPNHPINVKKLEKYKEEQREEEQLKMIDRRTNIAMRTQMLKSFSMMGGEGQQNNHSLFSPEMMVMTGNARWEIVGKREDGSNIYQIVPNVGNPPPGLGVPGQGPMDQMNVMVMTMKSMMEMMAQIAKPNQTQETFLASIMQGISQRVFSQPNSPVEDLSKAFEFFTKLKGPDIPSTALPHIDPTVAIETKRMETDKEFGLKILELKNKEMDLKHQRAVEGDKEANNNIMTLLGGLQTVLPHLLEMGKNLFMKGAAAGGGGGMAAGLGPEGGGGQQTPIQTLIKMEYEKEKQRKQLEAQRAEREWQEEVRRRNEENAMSKGGGVYQPQPETQRVMIQPPPEQKQQGELNEDFTEETFIPYAPEALEEAIRTVDKNMEILERYRSMAGSVLQEKIANGEKQGQQRQQPQPEIIQTPPHPSEEVGGGDGGDGGEEEGRTDFVKELDKVPVQAYDPDYKGPEEVVIEQETAITTVVTPKKKSKGKKTKASDLEKEEVEI